MNKKLKQQNEIMMMEQMERERRREALNKIPQPFLLKRIWAGILDMLMIFLVAFGIQMAFYHGGFKAIGYFDLLDEVHELYDESGLFTKTATNSYVEIEYKDGNYDEILIRYYSTDTYAKKNNKLESYVQSKKESNLFDYDENDNFTLKENVKQEDVKVFYLKQYKEAQDYFQTNPIYQSNMTRSLYIMILSCLLAITLSSMIFYLIIPLCRKEGETLSQMINKLCVIDFRDKSQVKKWQIVVRYFIILFFDIYFSVILFVMWNTASMIPLIVSIGMICLTKTNYGPHDYLSQSRIILKARAGALDILETVSTK